MWNKGPRQGPRMMGPPFAGGGAGGGGGGSSYRQHYHNSMPNHRLPSPNFDYGCGPPLPPPPHFMQFVNGPPGRYGCPPGLSRGPLLPSPPFVPMQGPPRSFPKRGFKRKRGSGGSFRGRNGPRNKMPRIENAEFFCDTCDRGFESESSLIEHRESHKKCGIDGCSFEAHVKIVELHIKMQHETGFAERIMQLSSTEAVEKWKTERKKNFPSAENIAKRQNEQSEKLARGELLETREFGRMNQRGRGRGRGGRGFSRGGRGRGPLPSHDDGAPHLPNGNFSSLPLIDPGYISFEDAPMAPPLPYHENPHCFRGKSFRRAQGGRQFKGRGRFGRSFRGRGRGRGNAIRKSGVRKFGGTNAVVDDEIEPNGDQSIDKNEACSDGVCGLITDSEPEVSIGLANGETINAMQTGDPLPVFVANGADDAESDSDAAPLELPSKVRIEAERKRETATPRLALPGALASLVAAYESEIEDHVKGSPLKAATFETERKSIRPMFKQDTKQSKPTLLEMLLAKEIRHERNVILQCVRYIVQNEFFDDSKNSETRSSLE